MTRLGGWIDKKITKAQTCPECRCGLEGGWSKDCGCTRYDCECNETAGPDTDGYDTFDYRHPTGSAEPARGKWWLGGRCSLFCGDVECPPCQQEERAKADQLPPASLPWLNGPSPPPVDEDRVTKPSTTPKPSSTTTTTPSGAAMTGAVSYGSLKAFVLQLGSNVLEWRGALQQVIDGLEGEIAAAQVANEDSTALDETVHSLMAAKQHCEEALGLLGQADSQATDAAARLQ